MSNYHGDFTSWEEVRDQFEPSYMYPPEDNALAWGSGVSSRQRRVPPVEPESVLWASYENGGYDGAAMVIYRQGDRVFEVTGSHCSCYGLEGQWEPEEYDIPTYIAFAERSPGEYHAENSRLVAAAQLRLLVNG